MVEANYEKNYILYTFTDGLRIKCRTNNTKENATFAGFKKLTGSEIVYSTQKNVCDKENDKYRFENFEQETAY